MCGELVSDLELFTRASCSSSLFSTFIASAAISCVTGFSSLLEWVFGRSFRIPLVPEPPAQLLGASYGASMMYPFS